jgi:hypothetical protein
MATQNPEEVLAELSELQDSHELSIIKLSEPISAEPPDTAATRSSDASADASQKNPSPATLETDLTHYKVRFPP